MKFQNSMPVFFPMLLGWMEFLSKMRVLQQESLLFKLACITGGLYISVFRLIM